MIGQFVQPDFTAQSAAQYKANLDSSIALLGETGADFSCHENNPQAMNVVVSAGSFLWGSQVVKIAQQTTGTITAPGSNSRIDRVVLDPASGLVSVVTGVASASPVAPAMPFNKIPLCQVLTTSATTVIVNAVITDDRSFLTFAPKVAKRQSVQTGVADASGRAAFLSAGTGLTGTVLATAKPLVMAFALGYTALGDADICAVLQADATSAIALPANSLNYEYADFLTPGTVTLGATLAPFQWGDTYDMSKQAVLQFGGSAGSTTFLDDFGNTWAAVSGAKVQTNQIKYGSGALGGGGASNVLNGTSDYVKSTSFTSLGDRGWSLRGWVYPTANPGVGAVGCLLSAVNAGGFGAEVGIYNNGGTVRFFYSLSSNGTSLDIASLVAGTSAPTLNVYTFIELTYDNLAGVYRLYVGGAQEGSTASAAKVATVTAMASGARATGAASTFLTGYIDKPEFLPYCQHPNGTTYTPPAAAPSVSAVGYASDFFSTLEGKMFGVSAASGTAATPPTFAQIVRLYLGEQDTSGAAVTASRSYAFRGAYRGTPTAPFPAVSTQTPINHLIGVKAIKMELVAECITADQGYKPGDIVKNITTQGTPGPMSHAIRTSYNTCTFVTQNTNGLYGIPGGSGAGAAFTNAAWAYRLNAEREF